MKKCMQRTGQIFLVTLGCALVLFRPVRGAEQEDEPRLAWGKQLYEARCASCHGATGKGNGPVAASLKHPPADLTLISKKHDGTFPRAQVM